MKIHLIIQGFLNQILASSSCTSILLEKSHCIFWYSSFSAEAYLIPTTSLVTFPKEDGLSLLFGTHSDMYWSLLIILSYMVVTATYGYSNLSELKQKMENSFHQLYISGVLQLHVASGYFLDSADVEHFHYQTKFCWVILQSRT